MARTLVWYRRDLRIYDHAPLYRAARRGAVVPVFVLDKALLHHPETAPARVQFMLESLAALDKDLRSRGGRLILRYGDPVNVLPELVRQTQAEGIYAYVDFERIYGRVRDARLNRALAQQGMKVRWFEPSGTTPELLSYPRYRRLWHQQMDAPLVPAPPRVTVPGEVVSQPLPSLSDLGLLPDGKPVPPVGTASARQLLGDFLAQKTERYYWQLSYPAAEATSGISPHVKFGVISVRECYQSAKAFTPENYRTRRSQEQFIARLRWGSGFAQRFRYLPQLELRSLYKVFDEEGWPFDEALYTAWQQGQTGFPMVDAAARCLMATGGWRALNFRSRALYASFLSNLLGMDWRWGALHFMRHLIDGDCPIDHYQWAMQSGVTHCADQSWTRIYNPGQCAVDRCDPDGAFIRRWVPEVAHLPSHQLGVPPRLKDYPPPIVNYPQARQRRVAQLTRQRQFRAQDDLRPYLTQMPASVRPFGGDRFGSETAWAREASPELFPPPLDLAALDEDAAKTLRTWFVASRRVSSRPPRRRLKQVEVPGQLSLL